MRWLKAIGGEIWGLFVDDGSLALAVLAWLLAAWLVLPRLNVSPGWQGGLLVAGLVAILAESTWRAARRR